MDILQVKNLTKKFQTKTGEFKAVDNISFSLKEGEILGVLGPNGAGKTTTIQMLLGVLTPTNGSVSYFGKDLLANKRDILEQVNFSSTYTKLPDNLTTTEIFNYMLLFYDIKDRKKRMDEIIKIFRLKEIVDKEIHQLSAGQQTRVNLAKAFLNFPKVLLLDEPTASLDPEVAVYIRKFLLNERKQFKVSIIFTSHNMAEVEEICDRVIFIDHGRIIADDTPSHLAKTIEFCHLELMIKDGLKRVIELCEKERIKFTLDNRYIVIDIKEKLIAEFLLKIANMGIIYDEISIDKPTLEDYFLAKLKI